MAVDMFLKIDGVAGESADAKHKGEIEILSFSWGVSQASTSSPGQWGSGKQSVQDFSISKTVDRASPKLMLACATGEHFKKAVLYCRKAGKEQSDFLAITLNDCLISSFAPGGHSSGYPMDQFSLNFASIQFNYIKLHTQASIENPDRAGGT